MRICIAAVSVAFAAMVHAEDTGITYKGLALGVTQQEFTSKFPDYKCMPYKYGAFCSYHYDGCGGQLGGTTEEHVRAFSERNKACNERNSFGGALLDEATAYFDTDGKLYRVSFTMQSTWATALMKSVSARYGEPKSTDTSEFQTKTGAKFPNVVATWEVGPTIVSVHLNSGRLGTGAADLETAESAYKRAEAAKAAAKKAASDF